MSERPLAQTLASQLLDTYEAGSSFFFASPKRTLLARGTYAQVSAPSGPDALQRLPARVKAVLDEAREILTRVAAR